MTTYKYHSPVTLLLDEAQNDLKMMKHPKTTKWVF